MISYRKLRILLADKGISWKDFKDMCCLTQRTVKKIKDDEYIDLETIEKICKTLRVDVGDIMEVILDEDIKL